MSFLLSDLVNKYTFSIKKISGERVRQISRNTSGEYTCTTTHGTQVTFDLNATVYKTEDPQVFLIDGRKVEFLVYVTQPVDIEMISTAHLTHGYIPVNILKPKPKHKFPPHKRPPL